MKKLKEIIYKWTAPFSTALFLLFFASACNPSSDGMGTLKIVMHDNPGNYEEVWVEIIRVEVNNVEDEESGWIVISEPGEAYNLLELVNGAQVVLGEQELEEGLYRQIRLILGEDNYVVINGDPYDLKTPSAQQTGIKLNINAEIREGIEYTLGLDFDANHSVVKRGQTQAGAPYLLKPVIRAYAQAETGIISGVVEPYVAGTMVSTVENVGEHPVSTTVEEETGEFRLLGLPPGTYSIEVVAEGYDPVVEEDIEVTAGETTDVGTIELQ